MLRIIRLISTYGPFNRYLISPYLLGLVIMFLMLVPAPSWKLSSISQVYLDLIAHALIYGVFTAVLLISMHRHPETGSLPTRKIIIIAATISVIYSSLLEALQSFVPGRESTFADLIANLLGIAGGVYFYLSILPRKHRKK